ncbi:MAG: YlqD family protein [Armatimonadota bacterium]|nr:YlqD family protein [Armatimonadota bacterium]MDR5704321.1 YlqD family protein [Armatimonadota bacterium]MDR7435128.1 YlqD family protein [Armatimonadota bacterium]
MTSSITLTRPVVIKSIVTESFKRSYTAELEDALKRVEELIRQIEVQIRRLDLERHITEQSRALRQQLEVERARQEAYRADLQARLREVQSLELNSEFAQGTVESLVEVKVGDNLFHKLTRAEIVLKDGIVMEIREG